MHTKSKHRVLVTVAALACTFPVACSGAPQESLSHSAGALSPSANDKAAFDFFVGKGLTSVQAAGIVGNLDQESQVDPTAVQYGGPGRGIAQWSVGGRWDTDSGDDVAWYAAAQGQSEWSLGLQLGFIWYELESFPGYGLSALRASTNVTDATVAFETDFEGCGQCEQSSRIAYAEAALAAYGGDANPCAHVPSSGNGVYCGSSTEDGFSGGSATLLYTCSNGAVARTTSCPAGCNVAPAGQADSCRADPCAKVPVSGNGGYCGRSTEDGFSGGQASDMYDCQNGRTASMTSCRFGCYVAPAGQADGCNIDPCTNVPASGDGVYCGSSRQGGFAGGASNTLYDCQGGKTSSEQTCGKSCVVAPAGQSDHC